MHLTHTHAVDHRIPLMLGTGPINVRPYRYAHFQKSQNWTAGSGYVVDLRYYSSKFQSLSFSGYLGAKEDVEDLWCFCVDDRKVNDATVEYHFLVLVVDELLDELWGALIFSKLDLRLGYHQIRMFNETFLRHRFGLIRVIMSFLSCPLDYLML